MQKLILIDGSSYLYRAFHALPPLSNAAGEPTGALFGVVNMLRSTLKEAPDYAAFVMDASGPTFRDELYPDYKAHREAMPDDLRAQIEPMMAIVEALGFPILRVPGVEADDVIGTLAIRAAAEGIEVKVSTSDKDFAQLVRPGLSLVNTMSGSTLDDAGVVEKFGVRADQIIDYLALMGDSVDNIPGVEKCGPKTAAKWLAEYGSLDGVIAAADKIGGKVGENLRAALPRLPLNRQLTTIVTDVALDRGPRELQLRARDVDALKALYARYGFNAALRDLETGNGGSASKPAVGTSVATAMPSPDALAQERGLYRLILSEAELDALVAELEAAELICFDTETTSLDALRAELVGLAFATRAGAAVYLPLAHRYPGAPAQLDRSLVLERLRPVLEDPTRPKLAQNAKYDIHVLREHGIEVRGLQHDSMLESFVLNSTASRHDMDSLAKNYLGYTPIAYSEVAGKGAKQISFADVDLDLARDYSAEDADITLRLHRTLWPRLQAEPSLAKVYAEIELPLVQVLADIEAVGVLIDADELRRQSQDLGRRMLELQKQGFELAGRAFNLDSPKQLGALLFDELGLPALVKTPGGAPSTNEEALEAIADRHELPKLILDYRGLAKLRGTYTEKLPEAINTRTGRVHTSFHQTGAATGRLSSSDPNLQNIPIRTEDGRRIRRAFIAPPGRRIVACDYSQIELRIMAHLSEDPGLLSAFAGGQDVHRATAAEVFGLPLEDVGADQRRAAKAINFGLMYGMSAFGLAKQLGIDRGEAQDYIALYFARYPGVQGYMERVRQQAREYGYVETVFGRRLYLNDIHARQQGLRAGAERAAVNAPMQGSAADIIKRAMLDLHAWLKGRQSQAQMVLQVHDELVFECAEDFVDTLVAEATQRMQGAVQLRVPLVVDSGVGANWDEAH
ncbi:DNA polymerase I [Aquimonas sp.]|jgi:DNA polymerase-1|uniref:DNA polymerase I n=1 Tax=Aquimonas sp. TaxID=1872588 RepID=UPI0037BF8E46